MGDRQDPIQTVAPLEEQVKQGGPNSSCWHCPIIFEDQACNKSFSTRRALLSHMRIQHNLRSVLRASITINVCPFCCSAFRSAKHAYAHAKRAPFKVLLCHSNSRLPYTADQIPRACPLCRASRPDEQSYDTHIRQHFVLRLVISPESVDRALQISCMPHGKQCRNMQHICC